MRETQALLPRLTPAEFVEEVIRRLLWDTQFYTAETVERQFRLLYAADGLFRAYIRLWGMDPVSAWLQSRLERVCVYAGRVGIEDGKVVLRDRQVALPLPQSLMDVLQRWQAGQVVLEEEPYAEGVMSHDVLGAS